MKLFKKLKLKDHVKNIREIEPDEWNDFNEAMRKVKKEHRRKQAASWKSAENIRL